MLVPQAPKLYELKKNMRFPGHLFHGGKGSSASSGHLKHWMLSSPTNDPVKRPHQHCWKLTPLAPRRCWCWAEENAENSRWRYIPPSSIHGACGYNLHVVQQPSKDQESHIPLSDRPVFYRFGCYYNIFSLLGGSSHLVHGSRKTVRLME